MPRIILLATGGTISSRRSAEGGARARDTAGDLLAALNVAREGLGCRDSGELDVECRDLAVDNSFNFTLEDLLRIGRTVVELQDRPEVDGVVVTHGTDTAEETLALLALTCRSEKPVVLTGAQRNPDYIDSDGPRNLADALCVAASSEARGLGPLLVFGGEIHSGWGLRKAHTLALQPFEHSSGGRLGTVREGVIRLNSFVERPEPVAMPGTATTLPTVDMVLGYPGADGSLIRSAVAAGAAGLVVLAGGAGNPGGSMVAAIAEATAAGCVVGLATRALAGPVVPLYGGGGAVSAVEAGAVPIGEVPAAQARILLALLLASCPAREAASSLALRVSADSRRVGSSGRRNGRVRDDQHL